MTTAAPSERVGGGGAGGHANTPTDFATHIESIFEVHHRRVVSHRAGAVMLLARRRASSSPFSFSGVRCCYDDRVVVVVRPPRGLRPCGSVRRPSFFLRYSAPPPASLHVASVSGGHRASSCPRSSAPRCLSISTACAGSITDTIRSCTGGSADRIARAAATIADAWSCRCFWSSSACATRGQQPRRR